MAQYTQANRPLVVTTPLGADTLLLASFRGHEAISQLFQFELELLAEKNTPIAFDRLVGQSVTVELAPTVGSRRYFNGILNRFSQGRRDLEFTYFRATMVPRFWLWTKRVQSRIFQHLTVPDILKKVLEGLDVVYQIQGTFHPRDYCVQYRESDFAFASRLMEEEGIHYYFQHAAGRHELVLTDVPNQHPEVPGPATVTYDEGEGGLRIEARVHAWEKRQELRAGKYTLWDHCFELPGKNLEAQQAILDSVAAGKVSHRLQVGGNERLEIYDYPGGYAQRFDGVDKGGGDKQADLQKILEDNQRTVKIRMEQETVPSLQVQGQSRCAHFLPGHQFTLTRHFDADGPYLLTRVEHAANQSYYRSGGDMAFEYQNSFTGIPAPLPYRPPLATPRPTVPGTQTATVVGPKGEEVFCDKYGRVKVQFPWDRQGKNDADSSCWIRVAQTWAGKGWGAFFWPRVGHEVVVAFEEGDPDRPLIVGSVYNEANMPPFKLPQERLVSGIKSCSVRGKPQREFNGLIFYDEPGNEHVQIHSQTHQILTNEGSQHTHVGGTCVHVVGGLHALGSGSGGGPELEPSHDEPFVWHWEEAGAPGEPAKELEFTVGQKYEGLIGLKWEDAIGLQTECYVDPFGLLGLGGPLGAVAGPLLMGFGALLGKNEIIFGNDNGLLWGPKLEVQWGPKFEYLGDFGGGSLRESLGRTLGIVSVGLGLVAGLTCGDAKDLRAANDRIFASNLIRQVLAGLIMGLESINALAEHALQKADEVKTVAEFIRGALIPPTRDFALWVTDLMHAAQSQAFELARILEEAAQKGKPPEQLKEKSSSENKIVEGNYTLKAADVSLISEALEDKAAPKKATKAKKGTTLFVNAKGSGKDGVLWLNGTKTAMLTCDSACVAIRKKGKQEVLIECDPTGEINIHISDIATSPRIKLTKEDITLSVGVNPNLGSTIIMTPTSIKLAVGVQNSIELTGEGIIIKGLLLDLKAKIKAKMEAILEERHGTATVQHKGTITTID